MTKAMQNFWHIFNSWFFAEIQNEFWIYKKASWMTFSSSVGIKLLLTLNVKFLNLIHSALDCRVGKIISTGNFQQVIHWPVLDTRAKKKSQLLLIPVNFRCSLKNFVMRIEISELSMSEKIKPHIKNLIDCVMTRGCWLNVYCMCLKCWYSDILY